MARSNVVGSHKTSIRHENGKTIVRYHATDVVEFDSETITLRTGGWRSNTTKLRMNQAANQFGLGYCVYQKNYDWFVDVNGQTVEFDDNTLTIQRGE